MAVIHIALLIKVVYISRVFLCLCTGLDLSLANNPDLASQCAGSLISIVLVLSLSTCIIPRDVLSSNLGQGRAHIHIVSKLYSSVLSVLRIQTVRSI